MKFSDNCPACGFKAQQDFDTCSNCGVIIEKYYAKQSERERRKSEKMKEPTTKVESAKNAEYELSEETDPKLQGAVDRKTKVIIGVIIPNVLFILFHIILLNSVSGKGDLGFAGMMLFYCSFVYIPVLVLCNYLIMIPAWRHISIVKIFGLVLPVIAAFTEYWYIYG